MPEESCDDDSYDDKGQMPEHREYGTGSPARIKIRLQICPEVSQARPPTRTTPKLQPKHKPILARRSATHRTQKPDFPTEYRQPQARLD
jgi:hypothetical protein